MKLVYEVNGERAREVLECSISEGHGECLCEATSNKIARAERIAKQHGVPLSDVTLRFVEE